MILSFAELWKYKDSDFEEAYYEFCIWANLRRKIEHKAAVIIQQTWREHALKKWHAFLSHQAIQIQKVMRGYLARKHLRERLEREWQNALKKYYDDHATKIQKMWRGYWSRKKKLNFAKRKEYLSFVAEKSEEVRRQLQLYETHQRAQYRLLRQTQAQHQSTLITDRFHHMLGTCHVRGAYARRPPSVPPLPPSKHPRATSPRTPTTTSSLHPSAPISMALPTSSHVALYVHRPLSPSTPKKRPKRYFTAAIPSVPHGWSLSSSSSSSFSSFGKLTDAVGYLQASDDMVYKQNLLQPKARTPFRLGPKETWVLQQAEQGLEHDRHQCRCMETVVKAGHTGQHGRGWGEVKKIDPFNSKDMVHVPERWKIKKKC